MFIKAKVSYCMMQVFTYETNARCSFLTPLSTLYLELSSGSCNTSSIMWSYLTDLQPQVLQVSVEAVSPRKVVTTKDLSARPRKSQARWTPSMSGSLLKSASGRVTFL